MASFISAAGVGALVSIIGENVGIPVNDEALIGVSIATAVLVSSFLAFWLLGPIFSGKRFKNSELLDEWSLRDKEAGVKGKRSSGCEGIDEDGYRCNQLVYWGDGICCERHKDQEASIISKSKPRGDNSALIEASNLLSGSSSSGKVVRAVEAITASWCPVCDTKMEGGPRPGSHWCPGCDQFLDSRGVAFIP